MSHDFAGAVAACKKHTISDAAIDSYRTTHGLAVGQFGIKSMGLRTLLLVSDNRRERAGRAAYEAATASL